MVYGGLGIKGIAQTDFYKFITSKQGLSELGIPKSEPPKLLEAYVSTAKVKVTNKSLFLDFGNEALLKIKTPHPASGTGNLRVSSWMEWVLDGKIEPRGFISRRQITSIRGGRSTKRLTNAIRLRAPLGGLMLHGGSLGVPHSWQFPGPTQSVGLRDYFRSWLNENRSFITEALLNQFQKIFLTTLRG